MKAVMPVQALSPISHELHRHLAGERPGRPKTRIHASDVTSSSNEYCPRETVLYAITKRRPPDEMLTTSMEVTFELGRMMQERLAQWYADIGICVGHWKCRVCSSVHEFRKRPEVCPTHNCNSKWFKYEEVRVQDPETGISCGLDLLIERADGKLWVVEVKTIKEDKFKTLLAPLAEHRLRTRLYLYCAEKDPNPALYRVRTGSGIVLYVAKGGYGVKNPDYKDFDFKDGMFSPFREYEVAREDVEIAPYLAKAKPAWERLKDKSAPMPARICPTSFCQRAGSCGVSDVCFGAMSK